MTSVDGRARAGPDGTADQPTVRATGTRPVPPGPDVHPPLDGPSGPVPPVRAGAPPALDAGPADSGPADTGTLRRSRPPRRDGTDPGRYPPGGEGAPSFGAPRAGTSDEVAAAWPVDPSEGQPVRRPVPPTFPSPGQPPPAVARRDGRHARPDLRGDQNQHASPAGYRPRHAAPDAETERFAAVSPGAAPSGAPTPPAASDALAATARGAFPPAAPTGAMMSDPGASGDLSDRVRVVLAERRSPTRAVRTVAEIEAQTETGELLLGNLLRAQLTLAVRLGLVALLLLGSLPVLFLVLPGLGSVALFGIRIPWLLVGIAPYPFLVLLGWLYIRTAERNELDFADNVED